MGDFNQAIELNPGEANRACAYEDLEKYDLAKADRNKDSQLGYEGKY